MNPGMGMTTASTPTKTAIIKMQIQRYIKALAKMVCDPSDQFQKQINSFNIKKPDLSLIGTPKGWAIYEANSQIAFLLQPEDQKESTILDLITPDWTMSKLSTFIFTTTKTDIVTKRKIL
jgi:hypothetical protein